MLSSDGCTAAAGIDAVALKPSECDVSRVTLPEWVETVTVDYEGREHLPSREVFDDLAADREVRVTTPVRADGFDPLGDESLTAAFPESVGRVVVAGHGAYLSDAEASRAIAPRIGAAVNASEDAWVGTEGVERAALATGATQFELLSRDTERSVRALRAAGFDGGVVVYAPTVLADDESEILDAVGAYVARRKPVRRALPNAVFGSEVVRESHGDSRDDERASLSRTTTEGSSDERSESDGAATDGTASGRAREVLSQAVRDFALVGTESEVRERVKNVENAGVDRVVAYPAQGVDSFFA